MTLSTDLPTLPTLSLTTLQGAEGAAQATATTAGATETAATTAADGTPPTGAPEGMNWVPFALIGALFYFVLIRPQSKEQKRRAAMLEGLKKGDEVMTSSGMFGTIAALDEARVTLEVAKGVRIEFSRAAVQGLASEDEQPNEAESND